MNRPAVRPAARSGFTLVELLIVIAIIGVLIALLLPAVQAARESARRTQCLNQLKQVGLSILNYEAAHGALPLAFTPNYAGASLAGECPGTWAPGNPANRLTKHNLFSFLLPYAERQSVYDQIDFDWSWNHIASGNLRAVANPLSELLCPAAPSLEERRGKLVSPATGDDLGAASTDYTVCIDILSKPNGDGFCELVGGGHVEPRDLAWLEGMMQDHQPSLRKVTDGLSRTFMLFENAGRPLQYVRGRLQESPVTSGSWANPDSYMVYGLSRECDMTTLMNCSNWDEIYAFHPQGASFLYGDGSARFHTDTLDLELFITLFTRASGDVADQLP